MLISSNVTSCLKYAKSENIDKHTQTNFNNEFCVKNQYSIQYFILKLEPEGTRFSNPEYAKKPDGFGFKFYTASLD